MNISLIRKWRLIRIQACLLICLSNGFFPFYPSYSTPHFEVCWRSHWWFCRPLQVQPWAARCSSNGERFPRKEIWPVFVALWSSFRASRLLLPDFALFEFGAIFLFSFGIAESVDLLFMIRSEKLSLLIAWDRLYRLLISQVRLLFRRSAIICSRFFTIAFLSTPDKAPLLLDSVRLENFLLHKQLKVSI